MMYKPLGAGNKVREWREQLGVDVTTLADIAGVNPCLLEEYELARYEPSLAMRWELVLAIQSLETLADILPGGINPSDGPRLKELVDKLYDGGFQGYRRDPDERRITRRQIEGAREAWPVNQTV